MEYFLALCFVLAFSVNGFCATDQKNDSDLKNVNQNRARRITLGDFMVCEFSPEISCFLDTADAFMEQQKNDILVQADREVAKTSGRSDEENSPTYLGKIINRIFTEMTEIFKENFSGLFKSAKEGEDDEIEENEDKKIETQVGEARKKKKKGKLIALIKLIIIGIVLKAKISLLLKALSAALQVKFFLVALAGLVLNAARFYLDLKKGHHPQKVIYYEHAQHQHHYEGDDDWSSSGPGGGYWGRSYDEEEKTAQDLAYAKQKPKNDNKPAYSWFG